MPTILVVDNSIEDQRQIERIFSGMEGYTVTAALSGDEAMDAIAHNSPDIVLLDPSDGSDAKGDFIYRLQSKFPFIPTIIVTTMGNEQLAIHALKSGAASYVPKYLLDEELLSTVRTVLEVSHLQRCRLRMLEQMESFQCEFVLLNDRSLLPPLVSYLQEHFARMGICDETEITRIGIALDEAFVNALFHGNLELDSSLRELDNDAYHNRATQRLQEQPYRDRRLYISVSMNREVAEITVRDEGKGFDPKQLPDPTEPANLEKVSGRGVLLMRTFMDEVVFGENGNCVTMRKRRANKPPRNPG